MNKNELKVKQFNLRLVNYNDSEHQIFCRQCGSNSYYKKGKTKSNKQRYKCKECNYIFVVNPDIKGLGLQDSDDVWRDNDLNLNAHSYESTNKLNFSRVKQTWLKQECKRYIKSRSINLTFRTVNSILSSFVTFSEFLQSYTYINSLEDINRDIIIDYVIYIHNKGYSDKYRNEKLSHLKTFFETGVINNWFQVPSHLVRQEDFISRAKSLPRYIPEDVMNQLNHNLSKLPPPVMRMILVIQETGLRVGELLTLKLDCLKGNNNQGWYIQYFMSKMRKEHTKPISNELAKVIQEQQIYIKNKFNSDFSYLFCGRSKCGSQNLNQFVPQSKVMSRDSFIKCLNRLSKECNITDRTGTLWHFQSHQFRHTVGTRMINAGVPQHIIQKYLGHESPTMTSVYAHIHDHTLRQEIEKYHESRVVNFQGESVELEHTVLSSNDDLEWFKKNVQARALEHGYCARPKVLGDCDITGFDGCYDCPHWRTNKNFLPILKDTLERTNNVIEKARNYGWELQVKKNQPIQSNLQKVIASLEEGENE